MIVMTAVIAADDEPLNSRGREPSVKEAHPHEKLRRSDTMSSMVSLFRYRFRRQWRSRCH